MDTDPLVIKPGALESEHLPAKRGVEKMSDQIKAVNGINLVELLSTSEGREKFKYKKIVVAGPAKSVDGARLNLAEDIPFCRSS